MFLRCSTSPQIENETLLRTKNMTRNTSSVYRLPATIELLLLLVNNALPPSIAKCCSSFKQCYSYES